MEKERENHTNEQRKPKTIIEYINIILSITGFLSLISGIINSLGYIRFSPKYTIFIFCISVAFYLLLNIEAIIESKKKTKNLVYLIAISLVLVGIFNMANWGADIKQNVQINLPQKVFINEDITGTATNIPSTSKLWIMVYSIPAQRYYPQHNSIEIQNGIWSIPIGVGSQNETEKKFEIVAVIADEKANNELKSYMSDCANGYCLGLSDLPEGAVIKDSIVVTRI